MRFSWLCVALLTSVVCVGSVVAVEPETDASKPDAERILGTWVLESSDRGAGGLFQDDDQTVEATFEESKFNFVVLKDGGKIFEFTGDYYLDDKQTPKTCVITIVGDGGANTVYSIYEFKDDKLRFRFRDNNGPRPVDFETAATDCQILTYHRKPAE